jgi:small subunit ribosomal protein S20
MKTSEIERIRNRAYRTQLRAAIKELRNETSKEEATKKFQATMQILDKAASYGLIHRKNADRNKSRLAHFVNRLP